MFVIFLYFYAHCFRLDSKVAFLYANMTRQTLAFDLLEYKHIRDAVHLDKFVHEYIFMFH